VYLGQLCLSILCFLIISGRLQDIVLSVSMLRFHPVQLEIVTLQYTGWCVLIVQAFFFNQFTCFYQFLMDNYG